MSDFSDHVGNDAARTPPPTPHAPEATSTGDNRFSPRRLILTFAVVLVAVVAGTVTAGALSHDNSANDQAMGNWMASYGSHYLDVSHDVGTVDSASDDSSLRHACVKLQGDVGRARSEPSMPLNSLEDQWSVILSNLSTAGNDCVSGLDQQNSNLLRTAQSHMTNAAEAYVRLVKAVQHVGG